MAIRRKYARLLLLLLLPALGIVYIGHCCSPSSQCLSFLQRAYDTPVSMPLALLFAWLTIVLPLRHHSCSLHLRECGRKMGVDMQ